MTKYKIIDNFLSDAEFIELTNNIFPSYSEHEPITQPDFNWVYVSQQVSESYNEPDRFKKVSDIELLNPINDWYLSHMLYFGFYQSQALRYLSPLLDKINPLSLYKIQANLTVQQEKRRRSLYHIDCSLAPSMITSIFYMNTTNGPTILEDGTEIECRANRLVSYPSNTYHAGVSCTDQLYRIVINLNYFKDLDFS